MSRTTDSLPAEQRQAGIERAHRAWVIERGEEPTVRELADVVGVTPSTISLQLRKMRTRGLDLPTRGHRPSAYCRHCGGEL